MKELIAFLLPPATAFAGMRIARLVLGGKLEGNFGLGFRLALGLAIGMVVFSQSVLLTALAGIDASGWLAWTALIWGGVEVVLLLPKLTEGVRHFKFQIGHLWLLLLLPVIYSWWIYGRLCTLEGTLEFDANAFWVFKSKIFFLEQGGNLINTLHQSDLGYAHLDYPMLVPCLYTLNYGAVGGVDEFINKVWPFWMIVALCLAILSMSRIWSRPRPLPILLVTLICFLPATLEFIRQEGGTVPMIFFTGMTALVMMTAIIYKDETALAAGVLLLAGCAATKFEGVIHGLLWGGFVMIFAWRQGWLKKRLVWKAGLVAAICLVPYVCLRLSKPVLHPESSWIQSGLAAPGKVLHRFPQTFSLNIGGRFFSKEFFEWKTTDNDHVHFTGKWSGLKGLLNPELSLLPWLTMLLVALSFWRKPRQRLALGVLLAVMLGQFLIVALAMSCLPKMQADVSQVIEFAGFEVGRYYCPFFLATFIGVMAIWTVDLSPLAGNDNNLHPAPARQATRPKKRH
jgi:hypothetical protein